jgi:3-phosphoglycerate kinase
MKLTVVQFDLRGRRVFLRADFNVPISPLPGVAALSDVDFRPVPVAR